MDGKRSSGVDRRTVVVMLFGKFTALANRVVDARKLEAVVLHPYILAWRRIRLSC